MALDGTAETFVFGENNGPRANSPEMNFNNIDPAVQAYEDVVRFPIFTVWGSQVAYQ